MHTAAATDRARETKRGLDQALEAAVPNWREIDRNPQWLQWLSLPDPLSGRIRQELLNDAIEQGSAARVTAIFRGFLAAADGAGQQGQPSSAATTTKPIYTRAQISHQAQLRRRGAIDDATWARWEHELIAAGREGRIVGALPLDGGR